MDGEEGTYWEIQKWEVERQRRGGWKIFLKYCHIIRDLVNHNCYTGIPDIHSCTDIHDVHSYTHIHSYSGEYNTYL